MTATGGRPRVALNMIVRDEERNLPDCLEPVRHLFDELVVVDTGSADRTRGVARSLGATVVEAVWQDDFATARNIALAHTAADYVFWLDADDRLDPDNRDRLAALLAGLGGDPCGYLTRYRADGAAPGEASVIPRLHLFPLLPTVRWQYRYHEQVLPSLAAAGVPVRWSDVVVRHVGYVDPEIARRKLDRHLRLGRLAAAEHPDDPFVLFNLGAALLQAGELAEAADRLRRGAALCPASSSTFPLVHARLAECCRRAGDLLGATRACEIGRREFPDDRELVFTHGVVLAEAGKLVGAADCFRRLAEGQDAEADAWGDFARSGHNLALVLARQGRSGEAEVVWRRVVAQEPGYAPAWVGLGEWAVAWDDWATAGSAADALTALGSDLPAAVLRARVHLRRREFESARQVLRSAIDRYPGEVRLRLLWSHLCLLAGTDRLAAE